MGRYVAPRVLTALAALSVLLTSACGYRFATGLPFEGRKVFVAPVKNRTQEPGLDERLRTALLETIAVDGRLQTSSEQDAELVLSSRITEYRLAPTAESGEFASQYAMHILATFILEDPQGNVVAEYRDVGMPVPQTYRVTTDVMASEAERFRASEAGVRALAREFIGRLHGTH